MHRAALRSACVNETVNQSLLKPPQQAVPTHKYESAACLKHKGTISYVVCLREIKFNSGGFAVPKTRKSSLTLDGDSKRPTVAGKDIKNRADGAEPLSRAQESDRLTRFVASRWLGSGGTALGVVGQPWRVRWDSGLRAAAQLKEPTLKC